MAENYTFPLQTLSDTEFLNLFSPDAISNTDLIARLSQKIFNQFSSVTDVYQDDTDPDQFIRRNMNIVNPRCNYLYPDEIGNLYKEQPQSLFHILCMNVNSLPMKLDDVTEELEQAIIRNFDILAFCEAKLTDDIHHLYTVPNYQLYTNNVSRDKGGVALYVHRNHHSIVRNDLSQLTNHTESLFVEISQQERNILVGVMYRRPDTPTKDFINSIRTLLLTTQRENKLCYITGDFNIDLLKSESYKPASDLISLFHSYFFYCTITRPTRVKNNSATLIDHIWSNDLTNNYVNGIVLSHISDHFPIFSSFKTNIKPSAINNTVVKTYRIYSEDNINKFKNEIDSTNWTFIYDNNDATTCFDLLHTKLLDIFNKCFPLKTKSVKEQHQGKPYITTEIKELIKERNKMQRKYVKKPLTYGEAYRTLRNRVSLMIKNAKLDYYKSKLDDANGNNKKVWSVINQVLKRNKKSSVPTNIPDSSTFNKYFVNVGKTLSDAVPAPPSHFSTYLPHTNGQIFTLNPTTVNEVLTLINNSRETAAGYDYLSMTLIKRAASALAPLLTHVFNLSIATGVFPQPLKTARVTPIHKSGPTDLCPNYRPVSVLVSISKLLERIVYNQLMTFINDQNLLTNSQYGFRPGRSTEAALLSFTDHVLNAFDNDEYTVSVFLDLSKAFDTVNHSIMLHKLNHYGVRGTAHTWFHSYLSNRVQHVHLNNQSSSNLPITCGVPQGSILGPLLFLLYVNDVCQTSHILKYILFADDTALFHSDTNICRLINTMNIELQKIADWLSANKLTLNVKKTNYIIFHRYKKFTYPLPPIKIKENILTEVKTTKFLGITVETHLLWQPHIKVTRNKIAKQCGIMHLIRNLLDTRSLLLIYYSLIYSNLIYCMTVWSGASNESLKQLVIIQKRAVRTIAGVRFREHTNGLFHNLRILKLPEIITLTNATFVFKSMHGLTDTANYFSTNENNTRNHGKLYLPRTRSTQSQTHIRYQGAKTYNSLSNDVVSKRTLYSLKQAFKKNAINNYSPH